MTQHREHHGSVIVQLYKCTLHMAASGLFPELPPPHSAAKHTATLIAGIAILVLRH